jgi:hypothetical protein
LTGNSEDNRQHFTDRFLLFSALNADICRHRSEFDHYDKEPHLWY